MTAMPAIETDAPKFELKDQSGDEVRLRDLKGKWVVLYFYPKDATPGCTREAQDFQASLAELTGMRLALLTQRLRMARRFVRERLRA